MHTTQENIALECVLHAGIKLHWKNVTQECKNRESIKY